MKIHVLPSGPIGTNGYLLTDAVSGAAVLIDAPEGIVEKIDPILAAEKCTLQELWLTHGHWDHTQDTAKLQRRGVPVRAHEADRMMIETPEIMRSAVDYGIKLEPAKIDLPVKQGDHWPALGREVEVRHVPGHCAGNVLFYFVGGTPATPTAGVAFVGDALFKGSVGRTDLPGGSFEVLEQSIRSQIYTLPPATKVFPGHGPSTTVGQEMDSNPYVAA
jgi:glyoxylase-like metal-dependent hydrolase (beta-lactamase superfamily II)